MLYAVRVSQQLEASAERFRAFAEGETAAFRRFDQALTRLDQLDAAGMNAILADAEHPGALPSEEWLGHSGLFLPFPEAFSHHRAAREWALEQIAGVTTVAVDGSEIKPTKDYSLPVAAVQVAWFENPHREDRPYLKDARFEIVHPDELTGDAGDGFGRADQNLALRRFEVEVSALIERMTQLADAGWDGHPPVAFFDGSLVVSFAAGMLEDVGDRYIQAICQLVRASEETRVPLVGFVDTSLAKDVTTLLSVIGNLPRPQRVPDSRLLANRMAWGDRTRALVCARGDVLDRYRVAGEAVLDYSREICFVYLKTNGLTAPARLDFPRWILRDGLLDHVVDVVRAEVIVGNGYPYCIETADACAVLSVRDRERFYRILQDFAGRQGIPLQIVPKAASKRRRRV
ncbi:MAG: DNA double-strand break repair nuclease NurA [Chloroflexota bacterium]